MGWLVGWLSVFGEQLCNCNEYDTPSNSNFLRDCILILAKGKSVVCNASCLPQDPKSDTFLILFLLTLQPTAHSPQPTVHSPQSTSHPPSHFTANPFSSQVASHNLAVITVPASAVAASGATMVFPANPAVPAVAAREDAVLHMVLVAGDVMIVELLGDFGAVVACVR
jgi:hypothetical protein